MSSKRISKKQKIKIKNARKVFKRYRKTENVNRVNFKMFGFVKKGN